MKIKYSFISVLVLGFAFIGCQNNSANLSKASVYTTTLDKSELLQKSEVNVIKREALSDTAQNIIQIDTSKTYQTMDGFGYTLTGGSTLHINNMSAKAKHELLEEFFGKGDSSIHVSYLRVSIAASDLNAAPFSYDDLPEGETDADLKHFSLAKDTINFIPVLKEIVKINPDIQILGSPWSAPKWMKDNNDTRGGSLLPAFYQSYANYFVKYIKAMKAEGITINAVTVQNEPLHPGNNPSMLMLPEQQKVFVRDYLGPTFEKEEVNTKIIIYDHNADRPDYPMSILADSLAAKYIDGSAFHLYGGSIDALSQVHEAYPNKNLYFTEQWVGAPGDFAKEMAWHTKNLIIGATRNWCKTVLEWNLAADENQQPHTDRGGCDRCLGAVTIAGDKVTREPAYYIIAQASKFIQPNAVRVATNIPDEIPNVAFKNTNGSYVVIIQNTTNQTKNINVSLNEKVAQLQLKANAIATLIL
ncbi:glycoside hydrolase family 30 beta sandwich domain-containing protein [Zhouia sp. PK063]|uniref:glycoside hydrolase family 30 protein n=1 Tax=Zhouia sp. PK063 TaxID=3373602 RepID=UPI00378A6761